jgi:predicted permease
MENIFQEIRYALRMLIKTPGFTAVAVLVLALGIGANTTIFSVVNAVMFEGLPYNEPEKIVKFNRIAVKGGLPGMAAYEYLEWRDESEGLSNIAAFSSDFLDLTGDTEPERINCGQVTADFFPLLGIQPIRGRTFTEEEDSPGRDQVAVVSEGFWKRRFGSDPEALGKTITLNDKLYTVIGIMPDSLRFPEPYEIWLPMALDPVQERGDESWSLVEIVGRLAPSSTIEGAQASIDTVATRLAEKHPDRPTINSKTQLIPLHNHLIGDVRQPLYLLFGAVGFVLLIACANVANLMLARGAAREREIAIRVALGAGRMKIIRQLLVESILIALVGGTLGILVTLWCTDLIASGMPAELKKTLPGIDHIGINTTVMAFTVAASILTGILFGIAPAINVSRPDLNKALKEVGHNTTGRFGIRSLRGWLVVAEVALALVLLVGAGLLTRSFSGMMSIDRGFNSEGVMTMRIQMPRSRYKNGQKRIEFANRLLDQVRALPEVQAAGVINHTPFGSIAMTSFFSIEENPPIDRETDKSIPVGTVSEDYFKSLGIPLISGRVFTNQDVDGSPDVAIVNQAFARRFFPDTDPVGKRIGWGCEKDLCRTVVGVVGDTRTQGVIEPPTPEIYVPLNQVSNGGLTLSVKTSADPRAMIGAIRSQVSLLDRNLPISDIRTLEERVSESVAQQRSLMFIFGAFAILALVLASVGLYGVMSYTVSQRSREIGIRMALGAERKDVLKLVVGQGLVMTSTGLAAGLAGAYGLTRLMESLLYQTSTTDSFTFIAISLVLFIVSLAACFVPALRATKVDPCQVMRYE